MAVISGEAETQFANQVANALGHPYADIVVGSPADACYVLANRERGPNYIVIELGNRGNEVLQEIDQLSEYCEEGTMVVVVGRVNDINFYRQLLKLGVLEYFTYPADPAAVRSVLLSNKGASGDNNHVFTFMSAASGDGASTVASNVAYALAAEYNKKTVLVDLDYQFGMLSKSMDLNAQFGIRELFDHPDRGIDATMIRRMTTRYRDCLDVISAPNDLKFTPNIMPETIRDLIQTLQSDYECVLIDLPHIWSNWTAAAISSGSHSVMVAQLWLRSITHAARLLGAWHNMSVSSDNISVVINRSGAKFKEGISEHDFERVCSHEVDFNINNDIRSIVMAENQGQTLLEVGQGAIVNQIRHLAGSLIGEASEETGKASDKGFNLFKKV
jgi:pilus assembly protein CpaE